MAQKTYKFTVDGEQTFQSFNGTNPDDEAKEAGQGLKNNGAGKVTVEKGNGTTLFREEENSEVNWNNIVDLGKEVGRALRDALTANKNEISDIKLRDKKTDGFTIRVLYKTSDDTGEIEGDDWKFEFGDGKVYLKPSSGEPVEICDLQQQNGTLNINKDVANDALQKFIRDHTEVNTGELDEEDKDIVTVDDLKNFANKHLKPAFDKFKKAGENLKTIKNKNEGDEEALWECDAAQQSFLEAIDNFKTNGKNKETVKQLLKSARGFKSGDTIQEKFKNAAGWYNIYKENPPQNTKEQVFLEDENNFDLLKDIIEPMNALLDKLKKHCNDTENVHLGHFYAPVRRGVDNLMFYWDKYCKKDGLEEEIKTDPEDDEEWEYGEDDPNTRYRMGDNTYKFVEWFGFKALLQNVDDDRDFELVTPEELKNLETK